jgi:hypothetical protein
LGAFVTCFEFGFAHALAVKFDAIGIVHEAVEDVWMQAVREVTQQSFDEFTGSWAELELTFVKDFSIPRRATGAALKALSGGDRLVTVESEPFLGKSHVLRECAERTAPHAQTRCLPVRLASPIFNPNSQWRTFQNAY